ncbi:DNA adenine methylase [Mycolicibacterium neoaurum]|nr:DNA adenine methylase [Mycolicibacterium neoaurum]
MGSKRRLVESIVTRLPCAAEVNTYYEPFLGGASVFLRYAPERAVLGDSNAELINAWAQIKLDPARLWRSVRAIPVNSDTYYSVRATHQTERNPFKRAVQFVYLNRNCFNGVYRTNRKHHFNVPFGQNTGSLPSLDNFENCSRLLAGATLISGDFTSAVDGAGEGDVVYLDPPWPTVRANYGEYGYGPDIPVIADIQQVVDSLTLRGADVYVSLPVEHSSEFKVGLRAEFALTYSVASRASHRRLTSEVLLVAGERALRAAEIA